MKEFKIPTSRYDVFTNCEKAIEHLTKIDYPIVIKASGLAAGNIVKSKPIGKGVILPASIEESKEAIKSIMVDKAFGEAGKEVKSKNNLDHNRREDAWRRNIIFSVH